MSPNSSEPNPIKTLDPSQCPPQLQTSPFHTSQQNLLLFPLNHLARLSVSIWVPLTRKLSNASALESWCLIVFCRCVGVWQNDRCPAWIVIHTETLLFDARLHSKLPIKIHTGIRIASSPTSADSTSHFIFLYQLWQYRQWLWLNNLDSNDSFSYYLSKDISNS